MVLMVHQGVRVKIRILQAGNKGFTLVELLIVFTLVVVFMSTVIINIGNLYDKFMLRESCLGLVRTLNQARAISIAKKTTIILKIDTETNSYWLEPVSKLNMNEEMKSKRTFLKDSFMIEGENIIFSPLGSNTGGMIRIKDKDGRSYIISIDGSTSKVSVEKQ